MLDAVCDGVVLAHGSLKAKEKEQALEQINNAPITIGTTGFLGEGLDYSHWSVLVLATLISSKVRLLQAIGRIIRPHKGKEAGYVADLVDDHPFSISSHRKREVIYQEQNYKVA